VFGIGAVAAVIGFIFYHYVNKKAEKQEAMAKEDSMSSENPGNDM
jgi:hypothetical protein